MSERRPRCNYCGNDVSTRTDRSDERIREGSGWVHAKCAERDSDPPSDVTIAIREALGGSDPLDNRRRLAMNREADVAGHQVEIQQRRRPGEQQEKRWICSCGIETPWRSRNVDAGSSWGFLVDEAQGHQRYAILMDTTQGSA